MSRKSLFIPTHEFYPKRGGIGIYVEELASAAIAHYEVEVWAPASPSLQSSAYPFRLFQLPIRGTQNLPDVLKSAWRIRKSLLSDPERILCLAEPGALRAVMFAQGLRMRFSNPCVLVLHGTEVLNFASRPDLKHRFQRLLNRADRIGIVSSYVKLLLERHFNVSSKKLRSVPGALPHRYRANRPPHTPPPEGSGLRMLCVARIHPRKGQHALLEALAMLPSRIQQQVELTFAGPIVKQRYHKALLELCERTEAKVTFSGELSEKALKEAYAQADLFTMTSMPYRNSVEGLGLVYLEAAAYGLPSIAHDIGGVSEAVIDGKTGLLASPSDRTSLANAIKQLVEEPQKLEAMREAAREHAFARDWDSIVEALFSDL